MTPQKTRAIVKALFERHSPSTVREGTVIADQIVNPLSLLGAPIYDQVDQLVKENSYPQDGVSGDLLDKRGERLLGPRVTGKRCRATVRIAVKEPTEIVIRAGSPVLTKDGIAYRIVQERRYAASTLSSIQRWGQTVYVTPEIPVEAAIVGTSSFVGSETLTVAGFSVPNLVGIYNEAPSSAGADRETNAEYTDRLKRAIVSRSLDTPNGILYQLPAQFGSSLQRIAVHGSADPVMRRDIVRSRRLTTHGALDVVATLTRATGNTSSVALDINGNTVTIGTATSNYQIFAYDPIGETFTTLNTNIDSDALNRLNDTKYGHYMMVVIQKGTTLTTGIEEALVNHLSVVQIDLLPDAVNDLVIIGRKGDPSFITREYFSDPSLGNDTLSFNTLLLQQTGASVTAGFQNKTRGTSVPNASRFLTRPSLNQTEPPGIFAKEINQTEYNLLSRPDFRHVSIGTDVLFEDDFVRLNEDGDPIELTTAVGNGWIAGNTGEPRVMRDTAAGVYLYNGKLVLGPTTVDAASIDGAFTGTLTSPIGFKFNKKLPVLDRERFDPPYITPTWLQVVDSIGLTGRLRREALWRVYDIMMDVEERFAGLTGYRANVGATSPVVQRKVEDAFGFSVSGAFKTTDEGTGSCAITMARTDTSTEGLFRWYEGYGISISTQTQDGLPNLFVIDNASTDREMVVVGDELVNGRLDHNVLSQSSVVINPNSDYKFELVFGSPSATDPEDAVTLEFRLWPASEGRPVTPTLTYGAYVPMSRRTERLNTLYQTGEDINSTTPQNVTANQIGIGVSDTREGAIWVFEDLKVRNVDADYAQAIVELDVRGASDTLDLQVIARGAGYNPGTSSRDFGHRVYVWDPVASTYDLLGDHDYTGYFFHSGRYQVDIAPYEVQGKITLLVTSKFAHQGAAASAVESILDVDFIFGEDYREESRTGGKADVLFTQKPADGSGYRPSSAASYRIASATEVNVITPNQLGGPLEEVTRIYVDSETPVDLTADEYRLFWDDSALRGSMRERLILVVDPSVIGLPLVIEGRVHGSAVSIQSFFEEDGVRKVDSDLLARHRQSVFVDVTATVEGDWSASDLQNLQQFLFETDSVSYSDILSYLFTSGATDVILEGPNALSVKTRYLSSDGDWITTTVTDAVEESADTHLVPGEILITVV